MIVTSVLVSDRSRTQDSRANRLYWWNTSGIYRNYTRPDSLSILAKEICVRVVAAVDKSALDHVSVRLPSSGFVLKHRL